MFDPNKPCRTRDGRAAKVIDTEMGGNLPIAAKVFNEELDRWFIYRFTKGGHISRLSKDILDLVNIPEEHEVDVYIFHPQDED